jgi:hypothetical protein
VGLTCNFVADPPEGIGAGQWYRFWKLLRLLEPGIV